MHGDFSRWQFDPSANYSSVLHQQGRVRTDADDNDAAQIDGHWRQMAATDIIGGGVAAIPAGASAGFKVVKAALAGGIVTLQLTPGRTWADGLPLYLPGSSAVSVPATYLVPPLQSPAADTGTIKDGVRDAVVLEVWEEAISAFQDMQLLEPALGGPDTTERMRVVAALKLMRLGPNDDCSAVASATDNLATRGKLTVTPAPAIVIPGDCPIEAGGGYTGFEHFLYRIEIATPLAGVARFKWSQFNGGLVGRGTFTAGAPGAGTVRLTANDQMINHCGLSSFYLEALERDPVFGGWRVVATADATSPQAGELALTNIAGAWPAPAGQSAFFRLWNGIRPITDFGATSAELQDGILLAFDAPTAGNVNYAPGDYWTFPVCAAGTPFDTTLLPTNAPPQGIQHHRVPLAILNWNAGKTASDDQGEIDDCRKVFPPLTRRQGCCTFTVGDGVGTHGDFDSIEAAIQHLPASGGEICLLPGLHQTNAVIQNRQHVRIHGCRTKTKVVPRKGSAGQPLFTIIDSLGVALERMDMVALEGTAILAVAQKPGGVSEIEIADNRILARENAISVSNGAEAWIHHNRIRMLDKEKGGVGIYLSGDDGLIERNDIRLQPAREMPPFDVPERPDPVDPNDPCADFTPFYANPRLFTRYLEKVWLVPLLPYRPLKDPARALGGIQIGGGSERVRVSENIIVGGSGNGITLGDGFELPERDPRELPIISVRSRAKILGKVFDPDGKPVPGAEVTLTRKQDGATQREFADQDAQFAMGVASGDYTVDASSPGLVIAKVDLTQRSEELFGLIVVMQREEARSDPSGFLYEIGIDGNRISDMGLSGIGVPRLPLDVRSGALSFALVYKAQPSLVRARMTLGNPVVDLQIRLNRIVRCLQTPFDEALRAEASLRGLGGISLGFCQNAIIADNHIEANGISVVNPTCGLFVSFADGIDITANYIADNGPQLDLPDDVRRIDGLSGGIVIALLGSFNSLASRTKERGVREQRPVARVHENVVEQPAGHALSIAGLGALSVTDNCFASELSGPLEIDTMAGTVFIRNIGGAQKSRFAVAGNVVNRVGGIAEAVTSDLSSANLVYFARDAAAFVLLPDGDTIFNDNQSRTGAANISGTCQTIYCDGDLGYEGNQSKSERRKGDLYANVTLRGETVRAIGNRFSEPYGDAVMSLYTYAGTINITSLNITSLNQGDHCIIAVGNPLNEQGNQMLNPNDKCRRFALILDALRK